MAVGMTTEGCGQFSSRFALLPMRWATIKPPPKNKMAQSRKISRHGHCADGAGDGDIPKKSEHGAANENYDTGSIFRPCASVSG